MGIRNGDELRRVFEAINPFDRDGNLKPESEQRALLASNVNFPVTMQAKAFAQAAAVGGGSPHIIQVSYTVCKMAGNQHKGMKLPEDIRRTTFTRPVAIGALRSRQMIEDQVEDYGCQAVFLSLDHFTSPGLSKTGYSYDRGIGLPKRVAEAFIDEAIEVMRPSYGKEIDINSATRKTYLDYMTSDLYGDYRLDFIGAVKLAEPTYAMIDTGALPPILNFATSRDIVWAVRNVLENHDVMIEAEFSATGQTGDEEAYEKLTGAELERLSDKLVAFVKFSNAEGIAYEIGMQHAAAKGQKHEPDVERLEVVQKALWKATGRHIPFAQHGGTGAARLVRGLVAKNNINTQYLVDAANWFGDHYDKNSAGIRAGEKKYCGTGIFLGMLGAQRDRCIEKIKETNTFGWAPTLCEIAHLKQIPIGPDRIFSDIKASE